MVLPGRHEFHLPAVHTKNVEDVLRALVDNVECIGALAGAVYMDQPIAGSDRYELSPSVF
jgi:hypothetical protein